MVKCSNYIGAALDFAAAHRFEQVLLVSHIGKAVKIAGDFVVMAIEETVKNPVHWYGVKFEPVLPELIRRIGEN